LAVSVFGPLATWLYDWVWLGKRSKTKEENQREDEGNENPTNQAGCPRASLKNHEGVRACYKRGCIVCRSCRACLSKPASLLTTILAK